MKKTRMVVALVVALIMVSVLISGCGKVAEPTETPKADAPKADAPKADAPKADAPKADAGSHELYKLLPKTSLNGVIDPNMPDRANVAKAWPKKPKDPKKIVVGWTEITLGNPWFVAVGEEAKKGAAKYGFDLKFQVADGDVQKQSAQIDSFITQGVDIIVVDPCDILGPVADIKRAVEAGIPVVCLGTAPDASAQILTTIMNNPFMNGFGAGQYMADYYKGKDINSAMIIGTVGNSTSDSRLCGMASGIIYGRYKQIGKEISKEDAMLKGYNLYEEVKKGGKSTNDEIKFNVLAYGVGSWTEEGGLKAAEDILSAQGKKLNLFIAENDFMGMGALKALKNYGNKGEIQVGCCADGYTAALDLVKSGEMLVTGPCSGADNGRGVMDFINKIFNENLDPSNLPIATFFPSSVFTKDTVAKAYDKDPNYKFYTPDLINVKTIPDIKKELAAAK